MIQFSIIEITNSIIFALIYGSFFAIIIESLSFFTFIIKEIIRTSFSLLVGKNKDLNKIIIDKKTVHRKDTLRRIIANSLIFFFSIIETIAFFVGYILISYFSLDGELRIYVFVFIILSKCAVLKVIKKILWSPRSLLQKIITFVLNVLFYPIKVIINTLVFLCKKIPKKTKLTICNKSRLLDK